MITKYKIFEVNIPIPGGNGYKYWIVQTEYLLASLKKLGITRFKDYEDVDFDIKNIVINDYVFKKIEECSKVIISCTSETRYDWGLFDNIDMFVEYKFMGGVVLTKKEKEESQILKDSEKFGL